MRDAAPKMCAAMRYCGRGTDDGCNDFMVFELCCERLDACRAAKEGGADRIELCRELRVGGLTPEDELIAEAVGLAGPPVHVLVRPHDRGFVYSAGDLDAMSRSLERARALGAAGVVLGLLRPEGTVDIERTRALVEQARPLQVTFHRAFDETRDLAAALEDVIASGCDRLLTSGGAADVLTGAAALRALVSQSRHRIAIACGGGLRSANAREVARKTAAPHFHGSLQADGVDGKTPAQRVREVMRLLREGWDRSERYEQSHVRRRHNDDLQ